MRSFSWKKSLSFIDRQGEAWLDRLAVLVYLVGLLVFPLIVSPWNFDAIQLPKQSVLFLLTGALSLLWVLRCFMRRSIQFPWDGLTKWLAILLVTLGLSALFSVDPVASFFGMGSQIGQAWTSWLCFFLLFCFGRIFFSTKRRFGLLIGAMIGSGFLVSAFTLFSWLGLFSSIPTLSRPGFNPIGGPFDLVTYLLPLCVLTIGCVLFRAPRFFFVNKVLRIALWGLMSVALILFFELFLIVDLGLVWAGLFVSTMVLFFFSRSKEKVPRPIVGSIVTIIILIVTIFIGIRHFPFSLATIIPIDVSGTLRQALRIQLPTEIVPSHRTSWQVTRSVWKEHPLFGSGQGTWSYGYDRFHEISLNQSPFWKTRFPHASSFFLTLVPTIGLLNLLFLFFFLLSFLRRIRKEYARSGISEPRRRVILLLSLPLLLMFALSFFRFMEVSGIFLLWTFLTLLATLLPSTTIQKEPAPSILLGGALISLIILAFPLPRMVADAAYARGLELFEQPDRARIFFASAHRWSPWQEGYVRMLSQISIQKGAALIGPQSDSDKAEEGVRYVKEGLEFNQKAIRINPANADHWLDAALAYRILGQVDSELEERALSHLYEGEKRQPLNPQITHQIAQIFLARGEREQKWLESKDERLKQEARQRQKIAFRDARHWLERSLFLKQDFIPARYDLAALEEREGKRKDAIRGLEQVLKDDKLNTRVMAELGLLYAQEEQFELAAQTLERFLEQKPDTSLIRWYLALVYERLNRIDDAIVQLRFVLNQSPEDEQAQERLRILQRAKAEALAPAPPPVPTSTATTTRAHSVKKKRR